MRGPDIDGEERAQERRAVLVPLPSVSLRSPFVARTYIMYSPYSYYSFLSLSFFRAAPSVFPWGVHRPESAAEPLGDMCT